MEEKEQSKSTKKEQKNRQKHLISLRQWKKENSELLRGQKQRARARGMLIRRFKIKPLTITIEKHPLAERLKNKLLKRRCGCEMCLVCGGWSAKPWVKHDYEWARVDAIEQWLEERWLEVSKCALPPPPSESPVSSAPSESPVSSSVDDELVAELERELARESESSAPEDDESEHELVDIGDIVKINLNAQDTPEYIKMQEAEHSFLVDNHLFDYVYNVTSREQFLKP